MPATSRNAPRAAALLAAATTAAALSGCYSASGTRLGLHSNDLVSDNTAVGDTLGAAMFQQQVRYAAAESRRQRYAERGLATVSVPVD